MAANVEYYNTGGGELFFTPITDGVAGTEVPFGQTENISFSTETETLTHDNTEGCVVVEDINILKKITGKITLETVEISPEMLTRAFLGTDLTVEIPEGTGTTTTVTVTELDTAYEIGSKYVSNVVVKDETDTTTYVEGTDYTIDSTKGMITALSGGAITAGDVLNVTYDNGAYSEIRIETFTKEKIEGKLRFVSCSSVGVPYEYLFHKVSLLASGDFSLKSAEELQKLAFEGTMLSDETITGSGLSKLLTITGVKKTA